ncbi:clp amino terminal domain protein [Mycolicibacterium hassiacum DSM 44199]|jgi:ATP-dependent Clp protease ATP-binding subunit ClpA|uniref:Clp amino terminal domain protein n=1 Tax=Mycolicibacterium hassiacum (strain DSM 44199 / CIP 105218 / JCM 12690 / 3849) TaxID=1122247 RepID=K5BGU9_MYCHD|nr:Clp protease N-terminal domain-containing protein [Mycolicibacterium hassiacum]EKF25122.1 clp amino terminal domain protein [Mycolicibacterium hassiacum DSM 44199]MBX5486086.1 Clp protease [Mycolicibacterium hassiacum]MDA4087870.1 Clp protease [Mycolicibacterium hassiacum DSM 44199]VCT93162.1 ATP-dependent Clp protease ATP-binding subunit ClpC1 [Mycolicibacterium hassiacum DSM 44199]
MFERFTRHARIAVILAQEAALELDDDEIRPSHLLVGVLQSAGRDLSRVLAGYGLTADTVRERLAAGEDDDPGFADDAEALRAIGIDLHAVRDRVVRAFGADAWDAAAGRPPRRRRRKHLPFTKSAKKALELALREALAHKDKNIGCEHVLLGILRGADEPTLELIADHVEPARLRADIDGLLAAAA